MSYTILDQAPPLNFRQRWNHYLLVIFALLGVLLGTNLKNSNLFSTSIYSNPEAGIRAEYPSNWLIDASGDYVFRLRNTTEIGYKTTFQVTVRPVSPQTTSRAILDSLTLNRAQILAAYKILGITSPFFLPDETEGTAMSYTYADSDNDPFLESVPVVVRGIDVLVIKRGQAIIITYLSDAQTFEQNYIVFNKFLASLEF
jgi:hypothetical protein